MKILHVASGLLTGVCVFGSPLIGDGQGDGRAFVYDSYNPLDDVGAIFGQRDTAYPFFLEAADDFTLSGDAGDICQLSEVAFAVTWWQPTGGESPIDCWQGVSIAIYEKGEICGPGFAGMPAGLPMQVPPLEHYEYCPGGLVCEFEVGMEFVTAVPLVAECEPGGPWEVTVSGLESVLCELQADHPYWIGIAPTQLWERCGQTMIMLSANAPVGDRAVQIHFIWGDWWAIGGNADACPPDTPPADTHNDLAIRIIGIERNDCPWDLGGDRRIVDAEDLAILLGQWGDPYGPADLAALLGAWGPC